MKKILAFLLVAVMAVVCMSSVLSVSAEEASVTVVVTKGAAAYDEAKLGKLVDGDRDLNATAFGSAGLVSFMNSNFRNEDGSVREGAENVTVELTVDLGEAKTIGSVYLDFFRDDNDRTGSFISLPSAVKVAVSADGVDYHDVNAIAIPEGVDLKVNTLTADFSDSVESNVRYIKATVTFDNEWIFMSEIGFDEADEGDDDSTETTDDVENTETTDDVENTETTDDVESTESTETTDDAENTESTGSADSTDSSDPASSDAPASSDKDSTAPETGDAGVLIFVVLGVVTIAGTAVIIKARG